MMIESGNGQTTIRAFSKQKEFISKIYEVINKNLLVYQIEVGCWMWYGVRMNFLSVVMMSVSCFVCIWYRESEDPVLMAMVFTYIIQLEGYLLEMLYQIGDIQRSMVAV